ncbi:MAG: hypothetical protein KF834_06945 [Burkholderiales bacterium]|nr:hypothetical protein [Burkholderiales bacterium]
MRQNMEIWINGNGRIRIPAQHLRHPAGATLCAPACPMLSTFDRARQFGGQTLWAAAAVPPGFCNPHMGAGNRFPCILRQRCGAVFLSGHATGTAIGQQQGMKIPFTKTMPLQTASRAHRFALGKNNWSVPILYPAMVFCPSGEITQSMKACP